MSNSYCTTTPYAVIAKINDYIFVHGGLPSDIGSNVLKINGGEKFADIDEYGCFDYIWFQGEVTAKSCSVLRDCGSGSLWASDHYPITAEFEFFKLAS